MDDTRSSPPSSASSAPTGSDDGRLTARHVATLWTKMTALFGRQWTDSFGEHDKGDTWLRALSGMTPMDVARGLRHTTEANLTYPPNASQFRRLCLSTAGEAADARARRDMEGQRALPAPSSPDVARKWMAYMRLEGIRPPASVGSTMTLDEAREVLDDEEREGMRVLVSRTCNQNRGAK